MTMNSIRFGLAMSLGLIACQANADLITTSMSSRAVAANESATAADAPVEGRVISFFVTTDADILSIGKFTITSSAPYFQSALGSDNEPAAAAIVGAFPSAGVDTYVTTPGGTTILGVGLPGDGSENTGWGDTSNDGAQANFKFAQLTVPKGANWTFAGTINIESSTGGVYSQAFSFVPEPASLAVAGMGLIGLVTLRRRAA